METITVERLSSINPLARQLLAHPQLLVFLVDQLGQLLASSPAARELFVGHDQLHSPQFFMQLVRPQDVGALRSGEQPATHEVTFADLVEWLNQASAQAPVLHLLRIDGTPVPVQLHTNRLPDSDDLTLVFVQNLDKQFKAEQQLNRRDLMLKAQLAAKTQVIESDLMRSDDSSLVISVLVEVIALTLDVERVSVWFYTPDRTRLQCMTLFMKSRDEHTQLQELSQEQHPKFWALLQATGTLRVSDVMAHPELTELVSTYFKPNLIRSLLAQPIRLRGEVIGYLFLSQPQTPREWNYEDLIFTSNMADLVALSCESESRRQLEEQLASRPTTAPSSGDTSSTEQSKQEQSKMLHTEKMATLGTLIAGVAHEINTPLGAINASGSNLSKSLPQVLNKIPSFFKNLDSELEPLFYQLVERSLNFSGTLSSREERQYRKQVTELLKEKNIPGASNLSKDLVKVGIVDDIDEFIPIFMQPNADEIIDMAYSIGRLRVNIDNIQTAVNKTQKIVFALKSYSRRNSFDEAELANIVQNIETVLTIYHNQLKYGIEVTRDFDPNLPDLRCYADELMQVWTNIIHNAIQAMNGKGTLHIEAKHIDGNIVVKITDSGPGIPPHILSRIFEAFFTTKPEGEGSGLGLDISRRIVEKHKGRIDVDTEPGRTTFIVTLPIDNGLEKSRMEGSADAIAESQAATAQ